MEDQPPATLRQAAVLGAQASLVQRSAVHRRRAVGSLYVASFPSVADL